MQRILYAEDEYTNRKLAGVHFQKRNIACDFASTGTEALSLFRQNDYALVILDQHMPGLNGDDLARAFREENPSIPLFAITSDDEIEPMLLEAGFNRVYIKPLRTTNYLDDIEAILSGLPEKDPC